MIHFNTARLHFFVWFAVACCAILVPAQADVSPPIRISVPKDSISAPVAEQEFRGEFEVTVGERGALEQVELRGEGWTIVEVAPAPPIDLGAGEIATFTYRAIPSDPTKLLKALVVFDGQAVRRDITVSPQRFAARGKARPSRRIPGSTGLRPGADPSPPAPTSSVAGGVNLRFVGCIQYTRMDGRVMAADGVHFDIMDDDSPDFDEAIYSGTTGIDGCFDITTNWDDCDVVTGCDDPDIYLYYETDTSVVTVQDSDILEEDYNWDTDDNIFEDFNGNMIDFGLVSPSNMGDHPALHIHSNITRAHRFMFTRDGTFVPHVDTQWPESDNGAFYNPFFNEIHIGPDQQWTEGTIIHEWGHHFLETESVNLSPDYCNGFCDGDTACVADTCGLTENGGHCFWCPETNHDAWNEGFPNWLGSVVIRSFATDYPFDYPAMPAPAVQPLSINDGRYTGEALGNCCQDMQSYVSQADITEGFAMALLRDVEDANPTVDNHVMDAAPDCSVDAMNLGVDEILQVVRLDKPTNPLDFINKFRARFPQHDQDFWSTCANVSSVYLSQFPTPTPEVISQTQACQGGTEGQPLTLTVQGNGSLLKYQWRRNQTELTDGGRISNATTASLTINPLAAGDAGSYDCIVTTCDGSVAALSGPIRVVVHPAPGTGSPGLSWGRDIAGELGHGAIPAGGYGPPSSIVTVNSFTKVAAGDFHSLGIRADGTVWGWGSNAYSELGATGFPNTATPRQVPGLSNVISVAASTNTSYAVTADGKLYAWGSNFSGEVGIGSPLIIIETPTVNPILDCVVEISAFSSSVMAILADGTVWTWGHNQDGVLGLGFAGGPSIRSPQQVPGITDAVSGNVGQLHMHVVRADGTVLGWGQNLSGSVGDGTTMNRHSPVSVINLNNVRSVAGKGWHTIALRNDGTVWGWGPNSSGQLGTGTLSNAVSTPVQVSGMTSVTHVGATLYTSAFLRNDGTVWVTGSNYAGGLGTLTGTGGALFVTTPIRIFSITGATFLAAGSHPTIVLAPATAVNITQQPLSRTQVEGQSASFAVTATGTPALSYQWMRNNLPVMNGGPISGANLATLTINPTMIGHAGTYTVAVTNIQGTVSSAPAVLTVSQLPFDVDANNLVNVQDFAAFADCMHGPGVPPIPGPGPTPQACQAIFDLGNDLDVDQQDFAEFQNAFAP